MGTEEDPRVNAPIPGEAPPLRRARIGIPRPHVKDFEEVNVTIGRHPEDTIQPGPVPVPAPPNTAEVPQWPEEALTFPAYCEWRMTKCPPPTGVNRSHATLEFIGEVAELVNEFSREGLATIIPEGRQRLIDEAGDIFFCAAWLMDAWSYNYLRISYDRPDSCLADLNDLKKMYGELATYAQTRLATVMQSNKRESVTEESLAASRAFVGTIDEILYAMLLKAGLLANSAKKADFQKMELSSKTQCEVVFDTLHLLQRILYLAGVSIGQVLAHNVNKINGRFPEGWKPGGGNRNS